MNRFIPVFVLVLISFNLFAGNRGMSEEEMQKMMEQAKEMQKCMAKVDQSALEALSARGEKLQAEVKQLCANGKRDKAQKKAIAFGKEIANSKEMKAIRQCGEMTRGMIQVMPMKDYGDGKNKHICDEL